MSKRRILGASIAAALIISALAGCSALAKPDGKASTGGAETAMEQTQAAESSGAQGGGSDATDSSGMSARRNVKPGGSFNNSFQLMSNDSADLDWWKFTCTQLNGWETRGFTFTGDSGGKCVVQADVTAAAGELDITVMDAEGNVLDTYKNVATSTFDMDLGKGGDYQIRIDGREFDGSFTIGQKS